MPTPTPTSEVPGGLPDLAALTALLNASFQAPPGGGVSGSEAAPLPGGAPRSLPASVGTPPPPSLPTFPQANFVPVATALPITPPFTVSQQAAAALAAPPSVITPRLLPTAAQSADLPAFASTVVPVLGRSSGPAQGVPEAYAAGAPAIAPTPGLADTAVPSTPFGQPPSSPFYFLGESSGYPGASALRAEPPAGAAQPVAPSPVRAPIGGVPAMQVAAPDHDGEARYAAPGARSQPAPSNSNSNSNSNFYFTDLGPTREPVQHTSPSQPQALDREQSDANLDRRQQIPGGSSKSLDRQQTAAPQGHKTFDVHAIRRDFPILQERVNGKPLVWFDNAATTQKPQSVIDRVSYFYEHENSNIHRAAHELAARATDAYESARKKVARFIGAGSVDEIIFVRGTTEAINLVAKSWGAKNIGEGDEIIVSHLEHHANIVPWQQLCAAKGAKLRVIPVDDSGQVILSEYQRLLGPRTKLVSVTQVSNALGTVVPVQEIVAMAHRAGALALVDGAQSVSHMKVDVKTLDADFFVFSGHKIFGPTGIGVVYGKKAVLEDMPPWQGGGNMIADVTFEKTEYHGPPTRFEAGTGNIADAVGLGAALDYVERVGIENIARYEHELLDYATAQIKTVPGVRLIGTAKDKASVLSFLLDGHTTEEVGKALNEEGIAVRTGHHCAQPILRRFGTETSVRPSLAFYNTREEVDVMIEVLKRLQWHRRS